MHPKRVFYTSDSHFGHERVILYTKRPFLKDPGHGWVEGNLDVHAMDETMIANWNKVVTNNDLVYHLGDFAMGSNMKKRVTAIRERLNGSIVIVLGNHDRSANFYKTCGFQDAARSWEHYATNGAYVKLRHHPPEQPLIEDVYSPETRIKYDYLLVGHVHEKWRNRGKIINVGVDVQNFTPKTLEELTVKDQVK